ncbi:MAG: DUF4419 domain-containing protein, partial [Myxococcales bacterium]|nr:DUF4419 domain-containing protein [Myxococcales bacterium]
PDDVGLVPRTPHVPLLTDVLGGGTNAGVRFAVDDVTPATEPLPTEDVGGVWAALLDGTIEAFGTDHARVLSGAAHYHPFAHAVQRAFDDHRPLRMSPDAVWLTLTNGFALHIEHNAEALRGRFVAHQGRRTLAVPDDQPWPERIAAFTSKLADELGEGRWRLLVCDFSTTTAVDRTASEVVMMGAFKRYFDYLAAAVCGIPEIELLGTVDDWRSIRERIEIFAEYGLEHWVAALRPLADVWVETAAGRPDRRFWRAVYKPQAVYAASLVRGWLTQLFPYLDGGVPNPTIGSGGPHTGFIYDPITIKQLPTGRTLVPVRSTSLVSYELLGGLAGVTQDDAGWLQAVSGWAVGKRPFSVILDRLEAARDPVPEEPGEAPHVEVDERADWRARIAGVPAHLTELAARLGSVSLHGGRWRLRPAEAFAPLRQSAEDDDVPLVHNHASAFADLSDGRVACFVAVRPIRGADYDWWVVILGPTERLTDGTSVVAKGIEAFLTRVLDEGDRPFCDEPDFAPESALAEVQRW